MNERTEDTLGEDVRQTHVLVDDVDVIYAPHETMAYFEIRFIGRRKRSSAEWGTSTRMYRCYLRLEEIVKIMSDINQHVGRNTLRISMRDQDELEPEEDYNSL